MSKKIELNFSQACDGLIRYKTAIGLSKHTIADYPIAFKKLSLYLKSDPPLSSIKREQLIGFFSWLQTDYTTDPDGVAPRGKQKLSQKSILNVHTNLSALWEWAKQEGYIKENLLRSIKRPPALPPVIQEFSKEEIQALLKACETSRSWKTDSTKTRSRITATRDKLIILLLLDTAMRATELCQLKYSDVDFTRNRIKLLGKGSKERFTYYGKRTNQLLFKHLLPRSNSIKPNDYIFLVGKAEDNKPITRDVLCKLLKTIGKRAGVSDVYAHRFRHSASILFLRNSGGGNLFALQELLGHTTLNMVRRYARIADVDVEQAHRTAGPVDGMKL